MNRLTVIVAVILLVAAAACSGSDDSVEEPVASEPPDASSETPVAEEEPDPAADDAATDEAPEATETEAEPAAPQEVTQVTMAFPVEPTLSIANFQMALQRGFWEDRGLDVELLFGQSGVENIGALTTGRADITFLDLANLGNVIAEGEDDLRVVMRWNPQNIFQVFALESSGITEPADLAGKKIGISGLGSVTRYMLQGTLAEGGLTEDDVELVPVGATRLAALQAGEIDALSAWDQISHQLEYNGSPVVQLPLGRSEIIPANLLVVTEETLQERPDFVENFIAGLTEATLYAVENPDETVEVMQAFLPTQFEDEQFGREQMELRLGTFGTFDSSQPYGYMNVEEYQEAADLLAESGAIPSAFNVSEYITNDYLFEETE